MCLIIPQSTITASFQNRNGILFVDIYGNGEFGKCYIHGKSERDYPDIENYPWMWRNEITVNEKDFDYMCHYWLNTWMGTHFK